jgi:hypothetical protein
MEMIGLNAVVEEAERPTGTGVEGGPNCAEKHIATE